LRLWRAHPIRSCIGCGQRHPQKELLRLYRSAGGILDADPGRRQGGRGAYLCFNVECLWQAAQRNRLGRALRRQAGPVDEVALAARIAERLREHLLRRLHSARRVGAARPGPDPSLAAEEVRLVVLADGAASPYPGVATAEAGPREGLALALQAPRASFAAVLSEDLAREIASLAAARDDFRRRPPERPRTRKGRTSPAAKSESATREGDEPPERQALGEMPGAL
jgi:predicted RNA-binding protein YlxR (DUF448 family)